MEINTNNSTAALLSSKAPVTGTSEEPAIASDFETFLKMLTVQMQNQDPLNPVKAEDFAVQLATFSGVEQAVYTNKLLEEMQGQMGLSGIGPYADWIGKEALAPGGAYFEGEPVEVQVAPDPSAQEAFLVVRDQNGLEVQRLAIPVEEGAIQWDGATASGYPVADGLYSFSVESWSDGGLERLDRANVFSEVTEARIENGKAVLVMRGGGTVPADSVLGLRDPT